MIDSEINRIKNLMFAVIWQSIVDYANIKDTDSLYVSAERWLFSDSLSSNFSFRWLCDNIEYDYKTFRALAQKLRRGSLKVRQNGRQLVNIDQITPWQPVG